MHIYITNMQYIVLSCYAVYATPTTTQLAHAHPTMHCIHLVIEASMSEPHTSELNGGIFFLYIYIYILCVRCMCMRATCGQYTRDLKSRADLDTFIFRIHRFRVVVVNIDILNTSRRAPKSSQDRLR